MTMWLIAKKDLLLLIQQVVIQLVEEVFQNELKFNTFQSDKFLNLLLGMVLLIYQKSQKKQE